MTPSRFAAAALSVASFATCIHAQGAIETVIPGRDFVQQKLLTPGLTDTWKLDVEVDEMLLCTVASDSFDPILELVDERGVVVGSNDGAGTRSELWIAAASKGAYEFRVSPFQGSGGGQYTYHLHRFRTEALGTAATASHEFGPEQWWHFRVALHQGDVLVPTVLGDGRLTAVLDAGRNPLAEHHGGYRAARDGDCFVRVEGRERATCRVLTQLARQGVRPLDRSIDERIAANGLDTWRFELPAGHALELELSMPEAVMQYEYHEVDPDARQGPAYVTNGYFDKGGLVRKLLFARRAAIVELNVRNREGVVRPYSTQLRRVGAPARLGESIAATLPLGDGVLFELPLQAGELVDVEAKSQQFDASFDLWDPDGTQFATCVDDRSLLDRDPLYRFLVTRPGTYRVLVHGKAIGAGAFELRTTSQPVPQLQVGAPQTVHPGDYLHLDLQDGEVVWLSLQSRQFDARLQVIDPAGNGSFVVDGGGIGGDVLVAYRASHTGRHTLQVLATAGGGAGELKVVRP